MTVTQISRRKKRRRLPLSGVSVAAAFSALVCFSTTAFCCSSSSAAKPSIGAARIQRHHRWMTIEKKNRILEPNEKSFSFTRSSLLASLLPRGGSTDEQDFHSEDEEEEEDDQEIEVDEAEEEESEEDEDEESTTTATTSPPSFSSEPLTVTIKTNLQNPLIDQSIELLVTPSRTISSVKQTLSRMLPSRPPASLLRLTHDSVLVSDDEIVSELVEDDEDDEEERDLTLILDIVPPVDPKFAVEAVLKMQELSTMDLLEAYAANAAAMNANTAAMLKTSTTSSDEEEDIINDGISPLYSVHLRQQALALQHQLESRYTSEQLESWREPPKLAEEAQRQVEIRGQRVRVGSKGGARSSVKRTLQRNLNINWPDTIKNFLLFLFFGLFGGRSVISRNLLLLGAPMCFVLQARPAKIMLKQVFYACSNPPSILLSLLPAPEQAILSFDYKEAWDELYGESKKKASLKRAISLDEETREDERSEGELSDMDGEDSSDYEEESESDDDGESEEE